MITYFLIGNTSIKVAHGDGPVLSLPAGAPAETLAAFLDAAGGGAAAAASVNPPAEAAVNEACRRAGLDGPVYVGRDFPAGVEMAVGEPEAVGIDRILNVKAAYARCGSACAAVDLGTAVSISVADGEGAFVGGAIMPGLSLSLRALHEHTAFLPEVAPAAPRCALGGDTAEAMLSGAVNGTRGAIKEVVSNISEEAGSSLAVFLTGTDSALIAPGCPPQWRVVDSLTLEGLRLAYAGSR